MSLSNKRGSNFGRMGQMLMGTHDGFSGPQTMKHTQFEEDKQLSGGKALSKIFESKPILDKTTNSRPFALSKGPDYMPSFHGANKTEFTGNTKYEKSDL